MDIRCRFCGEPWEIDSLHEQIAEEHPDKPWYVDGKYDDAKYATYFQAMRKRFMREGCAVFGTGHGDIAPKNSIFGELMDLAGDDIDFAATMIEDAERFGLLD